MPSGAGPRLALDRDQDGSYNHDEFEAGSDPDDPSVTPLTPEPRRVTLTSTAGNAHIQFYGRIGATYQIQAREDLQSKTAWVNLGDPITLATNPTTWSEPLRPGELTQFYRLVHLP